MVNLTIPFKLYSCSNTGAYHWRAGSLHISVHFKPLARHVHSGNLHDRAHLQESNCNTDLMLVIPSSIQWLAVHYHRWSINSTLDLAQMAYSASITSKLKPVVVSMKDMHSLHKVEVHWNTPILVEHKKIDTAGHSHCGISGR